MRFGSVCSGIEAASVAWHPLGWTAAWLAEIEPFPCAVLAHHYPDVPNLGDMTAIVRRVLTGEVEAPDVFTGGTPCQAFSVAGLRQSLADARGTLSLTFCDIANASDHVRVARGDAPAVIVWENVPGVLSTADNAFGCFLAGLAGEDEPIVPPGGKWTNAGYVLGPKRAVAWRVLDAQFFGVAQRRRRVWVVASARDGFDPAAVLFEFDGVRRDSAPSREQGEGAAARVAEGAGVRRWPADVASTLNAAFGEKQGLEDQHALSGAPLFVPAQPVGVTVHGTDPTVQKVASYDDVAQCLRARTPGNIDNSSTTVVQQPVAFDTTQITSATNRCNPQAGDPCHPLAAGAHAPAIAWSQEVADPLTAHEQKTYTHEGTGNFRTRNVQAVAVAHVQVCPTLRAGGNSTGGDRPPGTDADTADSLLTVAVAIRTAQTGSNGWGVNTEGTAYTLDSAQQAVAVAWSIMPQNSGRDYKARQVDVLQPLMASGPQHGNQGGDIIQTAMAVRRLTPRECERLQGFPDDWTMIPWRGKPADQCPDGPRYKALGNSWAVPCAAWIGRRIKEALA